MLSFLIYSVLNDRTGATDGAQSARADFSEKMRELERLVETGPNAISNHSPGEFLGTRTPLGLILRRHPWPESTAISPSEIMPKTRERLALSAGRK